MACQISSVINGITGCSNRKAPSKRLTRLAQAARPVSALVPSINRGLISSRYQSQNSPQKKS